MADPAFDTTLAYAILRQLVTDAMLIDSLRMTADDDHAKSIIQSS